MKITPSVIPTDSDLVYLSILIQTKADLEDLLARLGLPAEDVNVNKQHLDYPWKANNTVSRELFTHLKNVWVTRHKPK